MGKIAFKKVGFMTLPVPFLSVCEGKIKFIIAVLLLLPYIVCAQSTSYADASVDMPRMIPPSPETAALFRFSDFEVSPSGIANVSIPLYTVQNGPLSLPISISYQGGGRRQSDLTGPVGMGWILNAGGVISRTVFGEPDDFCPVPPTQRKASELNIKDDYEYLASFFYRYGERYAGSQDSEYDIFSYSAQGLAGSFVLYHGMPTQLNGDPVKITGTPKQGFEITAPSGIIYSFKYAGSSMMSASGKSVSCLTTWYLDKITSPDKRHTITLKYKAVRLSTGSPDATGYMYGGTLTFRDNKQGEIDVRSLDEQTNRASLSFGASRLEEIDFGTGKVLFDIEDVGGKITSIRVLNSADEVVKMYQFSHSELDRSLNFTYYKLDKLSCVSGTQKAEIYQFGYHASSNSSTGTDYWGYRNGNTGGLFPLFNVNSLPLNINKPTEALGRGTANRKPNFAKTQEGVLKEIIYPTGNKTEFIYEQNQYSSVGVLTDGPGIRIKQVKTTDDTGKIIYKTYEYVPGSLRYHPKVEYSCMESYWIKMDGSVNQLGTSVIYHGSYRQRMYTSDLPADVSYLASDPVFYGTITEYNGTVEQNQGMTVYAYTNPMNYTYSRNIPRPVYPDPGSLHYLYPTYMPRSFVSDAGAGAYTLISEYGSEWRQIRLVSKSDYIRENGTYRLVKQVTNQYKSIEGEKLHGLKIFKYLHFHGDNSSLEKEALAGKIFGLPVFLWSDYYITCGTEQLAAEIETDYSGTTAITTKREYQYNSRNLLSNVLLTTSQGEIIREEFTYPFDPEHATADVYTKMVNLHILDQPVTRTRKLNNTVEKVITEFKDFNTAQTQILPAALKIQSAGRPAETRIEYLNYDSYNNPVYVVKDNYEKVVYLWGYNGLYPVAEIVNATYAEVKAALGNVEPTGISSNAAYHANVLNLRTNLPHAQVTLYKYKPLVGMIEVTDPNGEVISYEYDGFNRLSAVRYHESATVKPLLESYQYNYRVK